MSDAIPPADEGLYEPLRQGSWLLAHLGQSLDGFVATAAGHSRFVNGSANLMHLHRLRALADAVIVGAGTVAADDPQLTVRLVAGRSPVRVVLDPQASLPADRRIFRDGAAPTLQASLAPGQAPGPAPGQPPGQPWERAERLVVAARDGALCLEDLRRQLAERGLTRLFVEGGGITVSRFLAAGLLDRLQLCVAPVLIGGGRPGLAVPPAATMDQALRPPCRRWAMGPDVLFDFDLRAARAGAGPAL